MANKKVCVSFDYENDRRYYNLLEAWNDNPNIDFHINDCVLLVKFKVSQYLK